MTTSYATPTLPASASDDAQQNQRAEGRGQRAAEPDEPEGTAEPKRSKAIRQTAPRAGHSAIRERPGYPASVVPRSHRAVSYVVPSN